MILTNDQEQALKIILNKYKNHEKYVTICGYAGAGKAQPIDTVIPTPNGNKKLKDIKVGDYVFDGQGKPTQVLGVYPQGIIDNYEIILQDGRKTYCNDAHIFKVINSNNRVKEMTVKEMIDSKIKYADGRTKYFLPTIYSNPVQYEKKDLKISPYTMGAFLGDGCCKEHNLTLSSNDEEIPKYIAELENFNCVREDPKNGYDWRFLFKETFKEKGRLRIAPKTEEFFADYKDNIICYAYEKSIPDDYKYSSIQQRYELLQGLFDTDGSIVDNKYFTMRFTSTSLKMINDVKEILYSLGYNHLSIVKDKRQNKYTNNCYDLYISIPNEEKYKLFKLKRKKDIAIKAKNSKTKTRHDRIGIKEINKLNEQKEMVCIYVNNEEHLYLTNDYIVTHNTTLVKFAIQALGVPEDRICYCAFCGKAAEVLRKKGNKNAMTLHKLLYDCRPKKEGGFIRKPKTFLDYDIVVVDEISLAPKSMLEMLLRHNVFCIFIGDNFQLPQISKEEAHDFLNHPDIFLSKIMRQAEESEIIRLTMKIRAREPIPFTKGNEVLVAPRKDLVTGHLTWADQILCATNATRLTINNQMREILGFQGNIPQSGEKIICLRNYWDDLSEDGETALVNGMTGIIENPFESFRQIPKEVRVKNHRLYCIYGNFISEDGSIFPSIEIDKKMITKGEKCVDWQDSYTLGRKKMSDVIPREFAYGYAITTHKSQGSEWDKVLVIEESFPFDKKEHARWLYTAATRAAQKLVLVRN